MEYEFREAWIVLSEKDLYKKSSFIISHIPWVYSTKAQYSKHYCYFQQAYMYACTIAQSGFQRVYV